MNDIVGLRHYWNHDYIHPGGVSSVGDVLVAPRLKQSAPDLPLRFESVFYNRQKKNGSKVTREPNTSISGFGGKRSFKVSHGWYYQDKRKPATSTEPTMASLGDYSWQNKLATVVEAKRTGDKFLPLPGPFTLKEGVVPRGGSLPIVTTAGGTDVVEGVPEKMSVVDRPKNSFSLPFIE